MPGRLLHRRAAGLAFGGEAGEERPRRGSDGRRTVRRARDDEHDLAFDRAPRAEPVAELGQGCRERTLRAAWWPRGRGRRRGRPGPRPCPPASPPRGRATRRRRASRGPRPARRARAGARAARAGRKPTKRKRSVGRPDTESAATAALGPGTGTTGMPCGARVAHEPIARDRRCRACPRRRRARRRARRAGRRGCARPSSARCARSTTWWASAMPWAREQGRRAARVLAGDERDLPQDAQRAQRDVLEVAERRGHHVQRARRGVAHARASVCADGGRHRRLRRSAIGRELALA